jgi:hypothetical protein
MAPLQQLGEVAVGAEVGQRAVGVDPGLDPLEVEVDRHAVEKGEPGVSLGAYATVLFVLGFAERLGDLADPGTDELGLALEEKRLPQRIRRPRKPAQGTPGGRQGE